MLDPETVFCLRHSCICYKVVAVLKNAELPGLYASGEMSYSSQKLMQFMKFVVRKHATRFLKHT